MTGDVETLTVSQVLTRVGAGVTAAFPGPVWVRGEVSGFRRTSGGAAFFRLADPESDHEVLDVAARGRVMADIDQKLAAAGVGRLNDGVEVLVKGTVGIQASRSQVRLLLLDVDTEFIAGRLAVNREEVLRRLAADGSLAANQRLPLPLVPLRVGLLTSRGSAAHADFLDQLRGSGFRFRVRTAHALMQGEAARNSVVSAFGRLAREEVDMVAAVRGGGSKLDLATFDSEDVGRAVAAMPIPVIAGIGHETDRSVVDEAAAVSVKTPTAAAEWLVQRVGDYAGRVDTARRLITDEARAACGRAGSRLDHSAAVLSGVRALLSRQADLLDHLSEAIAEGARRALSVQEKGLMAMAETLGAIGVGPTLRRGFALVTDAEGRVVRSREAVAVGDPLEIELADGTFGVRVEEIGD